MENSSVLKSKKKKKRIITILIILFILFFGRPYYKPAYSGRVVDFETGEPIVGAMVEVEYWIGGYGPVEQYSKDIHWLRVKTDKNGYFEFPKYFTLIGIFNYERSVVFTVRKDSYTLMLGMSISDCLSSGCDEKIFSNKDGSEKICISKNIIGLKKLKKDWK